MNRYTIVLAEEKETIQRLVNKAIDTKPKGQERIESVKLVSDETAFRESLNHYPSIILLSTTLSSTSHESLLKEVTERLPNTKVISLTHKYGDRSSLEYGAFDSVDKPIRNPVLWRVLDGAIEAMDTGTPVKHSSSKSPQPVLKADVKEIPVPVVEQESPIVIAPVVQETVRTKEETPVVIIEPKPVEEIPIVAPSRPAQTNKLLVVSDDDDEDDDDLFGDDVPVRRNPQPVLVNPVLVEKEVEEVEELIEPTHMGEDEGFDMEAPTTIETSEVPPEDEFFEFDLPLAEESVPVNESTHEGLGQDNGMIDEIPAVEFNILSKQEEDAVTEPAESFSFDVIEEEENETENAPEDAFSIELPAMEADDSVELPTVLTKHEYVPEPTPIVLIEEPPVPEKVVAPEPPTVPVALEPASDTLEPKEEINAEASIYNELSEWTLAHEGFKTKKGEFVPLAPPREMMMKHSASGGKANRTNSTKAVSNDGDGLFGSVRNIFKNKNKN